MYTIACISYIRNKLRLEFNQIQSRSEWTSIMLWIETVIKMSAILPIQLDIAFIRIHIHRKTENVEQRQRKILATY